MLWAGTHRGGHKLEEARAITKDPGPSPSSSPAGLAPLATPFIGPNSTPGELEPGPSPRRLKVPSPDHCFGPHFGEAAPDYYLPGARSGSRACALRGALPTLTAEFAPLLGPFEKRRNF